MALSKALLSRPQTPVNPLAPVMCDSIFKYVIYKHTVVSDI